MRGNWDGHGFGGGGRRGWGGDNGRWEHRNKIDAWREANPDFRKSWQTAQGIVSQMNGKRTYFGECRDCYNEIVAVRDIDKRGPKYQSGPTQLGRWPILCDECRDRKQQESYTKNRKYAANYRRKLYERRGRAPHQGVPGGHYSIEARWKRDDELQEHFDQYHNPDYGEETDCHDPKCRYRKTPNL